MTLHTTVFCIEKSSMLSSCMYNSSTYPQKLVLVRLMQTFFLVQILIRYLFFVASKSQTNSTSFLMLTRMNSATAEIK